MNLESLVAAEAKELKEKFPASLISVPEGLIEHILIQGMKIGMKVTREASDE